MSAREFVIPVIAFGLGVNILILRGYHVAFQLAYFITGILGCWITVALLDDYDRKSKRDQEERQRIAARDKVVKKFIDSLKIGEEMPSNMVKHIEAFEISTKRFPGKEKGIIEEITYSFNDDWGYQAEFTTSDRIVTTVTINNDTN
jgi:hypothetical protein